jgi:hypothetical protein
MASTMKVSFSTNKNIRMKAIDQAKLSILLLIGVWAFSFKENLLSIFYSYTDSNYETHGFLALFACGILYLSKYKSLTRMNIQSSQMGLFCLLIATLCWCLANISGIHILEIISCLAILPMIFFTTFGWPAFKKMYFALFFIFGALPIGQIIGANVAEDFFSILVKILSLTSNEVYWQNNLIEFNNTTFDISNLTQVLQNAMCLFTFTLFISYFLADNFFKRIIIGLMALLMPIALLILTQFIVIRFDLVNSYTQESVFTYIIIALGLVLTFILSKLGKSRRKKSFNMYNESMEWQHSHNTRARWIKPTIVGMCILLAFPFATHSLKNHVLNYKGDVFLALPVKIGKWHETAKTSHQAQANTLIKTYQHTYPLAIELRAKFFETAIMNEQNNLALLNDKWELIKERTLTQQVLGQNIEIMEKIYTDNNKYQLLWSFYDIHQHIFAKDNYAAIADNWYTLIKSSRRSSLITLAVNCTGNIEEVREQLHDFLTSLWPDLPTISNPPRKFN